MRGYFAPDLVNSEVYAASHLIPTDNLKRLETKLKRLSRRKAIGKVETGIEYSIHDEVLEPYKVFDESINRTVTRYRSYTWLTIVGSSPKINGWELVARYEWESTADGKRICFAHSVPNMVIPEEYRDIDSPFCEHCNTKRKRNNVFLLKHENGDHKVVARNCIKDFLGHSSPENLIWWASFIKSVNESTVFEGGATGSTSCDNNYTSLIETMAWAVAIYEKKGWVSVGRCNWNKEKPTSYDVDIALTDMNIKDAGGNYVYEECEREERRKLLEMCPLIDEHFETAERIIDLIKETSENDNSDYVYKLNKIVGAGHVSRKNRSLFVSGLTLLLGEKIKKEREERKKKELERKAKMPDVEEGRYEISGEIKKATIRTTNYGYSPVETVKVTIEDKEGRRYWGSLPTKIEDKVAFPNVDFIELYDLSEWYDWIDKLEGRTILLRGTVSISDKDSKFGFYKRPHGVIIS